MDKFDFSSLIHEAKNVLIAGRSYQINKILDSLIDALIQHPYGRGSADACYVIGMIHMGASDPPDPHRSEIVNLLVNRLYETINEEEHYFNSLVNLVKACIDLKSYNEAFKYGLIAEEIYKNIYGTDNKDDVLLENMALATYLSGNKDKAKFYFKQLKKFFKHLVVDAYSIIKEHENKIDDASGEELVKKFYELISPQSYTQSNYRECLVELQKKPNIPKAWKCWRILCELHLKALAEEDNEFLKLQEIACIAASSGKAIAFHPKNAEDDYELWYWRGKYLGELFFYNLAIEALEKAISIDPKNKESLRLVKDIKKKRKKLESKQDIKKLIYELGDKQDKIYERAIDAIVKIGEPAVRNLCIVLADKSEEWLRRKNAAVALGRLDCYVNPEIFISALKDPNRNVQQGAAWAIGKRRIQEAIPTLSELLYDLQCSWYSKSLIADALLKINTSASRSEVEHFKQHIIELEKKLQRGERTQELETLHDYLVKQIPYDKQATSLEEMRDDMLMALRYFRTQIDKLERSI